MLAIFSKELRSLFLSPLAWSLMIALQLLLAWLFLVQLEQYLEIQPKLAGLENAPGVSALVVAPLLDSAGRIIMLLVPLLTMGMFSRESGSGTLDLLFSSPVSMIHLTLKPSRPPRASMTAPSAFMLIQCCPLLSAVPRPYQRSSSTTMSHGLSPGRH